MGHILILVWHGFYIFALSVWSEAKMVNLSSPIVILLYEFPGDFIQPYPIILHSKLYPIHYHSGFT